MNTISWVLQGIIAFAFFMAGSIKSTQNKEFIKEKLGPWTDDFSLLTIKTIGVLQILSAIGLVLPMWLNGYSFLIPTAALGLLFTMGGAIYTHFKRNEKKEMMIPIIITVLLGVIFISRQSLLF